MNTVLRSINPWTGDVVTELPASSNDAVNAHCDAAQKSFYAWQADPTKRRDLLLGFAEMLTHERATLINALCVEAGKNLADASAEADLLVKKIHITLEAGLARTPLQSTATNEPQIIWRPRGVAAILGPFNFPLHLLHGLIIPALAVGCTVVAKPSEHCPALGKLYEKIIQASGLSDYCRIVYGQAETAQTLITHSAITTVAAVGGKRMGAALTKTLAQRPEVVLALELGGVNPALVLPDADLTAAATAIADGAWRMAGQRCTATRHVHVPLSHVHELVQKLELQRQLWVPTGLPDGPNGALIHHAAREQIKNYVSSLPAGLTIRAGDITRQFANSTCVDPFILVVDDPAVRESDAYREEHFGPVLIIDPYDDLNDCLYRLADNPYRLACSVFTADREKFLSLATRLPYGQLNHNRPTAGARSDMPFGGVGAAGNGHPAAVAACAIFADECVVW